MGRRSLSFFHGLMSGPLDRLGDSGGCHYNDTRVLGSALLTGGHSNHSNHRCLPTELFGQRRAPCRIKRPDDVEVGPHVLEEAHAPSRRSLLRGVSAGLVRLSELLDSIPQVLSHRRPRLLGRNAREEEENSRKDFVEVGITEQLLDVVRNGIGLVRYGRREVDGNAISTHADKTRPPTCFIFVVMSPNQFCTTAMHASESMAICLRAS